MRFTVRAAATGLMILLIVLWTVPVCCVAMSNVAADAMTAHHHHHASHDGNPSSARLAASRSEPVRCNVPTVNAVSLPPANELSLLNAIAPSHAQAVPLPFALHEVVRSSAGPPGLASLPASHAVPLRI